MPFRITPCFGLHHESEVNDVVIVIVIEAYGECSGAVYYVTTLID